MAASASIAPKNTCLREHFIAITAAMKNVLSPICQASSVERRGGARCEQQDRTEHAPSLVRARHRPKPYL